MTEPYYSDSLVTLYHGDCREVTEWLVADVLVTDPPYGSQTSGDGYGRRQNVAASSRATATENTRDGFTIANDHSTECRDSALGAWGRRPAAVFGSPRMADPPIVVADRLVWDKKRPGMNGGPWRYRHESIYVTDGFLRIDNFASSIIEAWPDQTDHIHAKPLDLMVRMVGAAPSGTVADPFAGSGSTLVAAKQLGRRSIGVELDERYCEIAAKRLAQQALVFPPHPDPAPVPLAMELDA